MTSKDFVIWLKGFAASANSYNITPAQWDTLQDKLDEVTDANPYIKQDTMTFTYELPRYTTNDISQV